MSEKVITNAQLILVGQAVWEYQAAKADLANLEEDCRLLAHVYGDAQGAIQTMLLHRKPETLLVDKSGLAYPGSIYHNRHIPNGMSLTALLKGGEALRDLLELRAQAGLRKELAKESLRAVGIPDLE